MAHKTLCTLRRCAFEQQRGLCHYCGLPMWQGDQASFAAHHGLTARLARQLRSTAEHLVARCDGGRDERSNIVAACHWCNSRRHLGRCETAPSAEAYRLHVAQRVKAGRWHPANPFLASTKLGGVHRQCAKDETQERPSLALQRRLRFAQFGANVDFCTNRSHQRKEQLGTPVQHPVVPGLTVARRL